VAERASFGFAAAGFGAGTLDTGGKFIGLQPLASDLTLVNRLLPLLSTHS
jgi:hypothetical protein